MKTQEYITVRSKNVIKRIELENIQVIVGDSYCSTFMLKDNKFTCSKMLKEFEQILPTKYFTRINKNEIINVRKIDELNISKRELLLTNGEIYCVSVRKLKELVQLLETLN